jgi:hypothetical protein
MHYVLWIQINTIIKFASLQTMQIKYISWTSVSNSNLLSTPSIAFSLQSSNLHYKLSFKLYSRFLFQLQHFHPTIFPNEVFVICLVILQKHQNIDSSTTWNSDMYEEMEKQFEPTFTNLIEWADNSLPRFNRVLALRRRHLSSQLQQGTFENPFTCDTLHERLSSPPWTLKWCTTSHHNSTSLFQTQLAATEE